MKILKKAVFLSGIACLIVLNFFHTIKAEVSDIPVLLITIPKTGTWLLEQCFKLLSEKDNSLWRLVQENVVRFGVEDPNDLPQAVQLFKPTYETFETCTNLKPNEFLIAHLAYDKQYEEILTRKGFKVIVLIRDPRDQLVSRVYYTLQHKTPFKGLQHLSFDELLSAYMGRGIVPEQSFDNLLFDHIIYPEEPKYKAISHIVKFYDAFLPWMHSPIAYTVRFEDLVGDKGGGSVDDQTREIVNIACHSGISLTSDQLAHAVHNTFGPNSYSGTFREGKIGAWKTHFKPEHKEAFKEIAGQLLINLGYEKDFDW